MTEISLHILDIVHNSIRANAKKINISITEDLKEDKYLLKIVDDGTGISASTLKHVTDPFTTSRKTRKVGMGLPLLKHSAEQTGGWLKISSEIGKGTEVTCCFGLAHIDRPPTGNIASIIYQLLSAFPEIRFVYTHKTSNGEYLFDTDELKEALDNLPVTMPEVRKFILEMIEENLREIKIAP